MNAVINEITQEQVKSDRDHFKVGDGEERIQIFSGVVIARKGSGVHETFTVRRISFGEGVERVFPVHSPSIEKVEVDRESITMRARMYYMRDRIGKAANKVKEKRIFEAQKR
jgi:large subunit ribosomal protein L19